MSRLFPGGSSFFIALQQLQDADDSVQLADLGHALDQVLLHGHNQIPPKIKDVLGWGLRTVLRPRMVQKLFAFLVAEICAHLTDGLHTADQVLLHSHNHFLLILRVGFFYLLSLPKAPEKALFYAFVKVSRLVLAVRAFRPRRRGVCIIAFPFPGKKWDN